MLTENHPLWDKLEGPYGAAEHLQHMLQQLTAEFDQTQLQTLFEEYLYHQQSIYSATYIALPYLAHIASTTSDAKVRIELFITCGVIESARSASDDTAIAEALGPYWPEVASDYNQALTALRSLSATLLADGAAIEEATEKRYILLALAAYHGYKAESQMLLTFDTGEEYAFACSDCQKDIYLWPENEEVTNRLLAYGEDPVFHPEQTPVPVQPIVSITASKASAQHLYQWADAIQEPVLLAQIPYLTGSCACPHCQTLLPIWHQLLD